MGFLNIKEAAAFLKVSVAWLYQHHEVPRYRIPSLRFDEAELAAWVKSRRGNMATEQQIVPEAPRVPEGDHVPADVSLKVSQKKVYHRNPRWR